jgi:hypothetical protein
MAFQIEGRNVQSLGAEYEFAWQIAQDTGSQGHSEG